MVNELSLSDLPHELIPVIFESSEDVAKVLMQVKSVCSAWQAMATSLQWKRVNSGDCKIEECIPCFSNKQSACLNTAYKAAIEADRLAAYQFIIKAPGKLTRLDLSFFSGWTEEELVEMIKAQPRARTFYISKVRPSPWVLDKISSMPQLKHLRIMITESMGDQEVERIILNNRGLKTIFLQGGKISPKIIPQLALLTELKCLTMQSCTELKDKDIQQILKNHPGIRTLHIINSEITEIAVKEIAALSQLRNLKLMGCGQIEKLDDLIRLNRLEILTLGRFDNKNINFLEGFQHLKKLRMPWYRSIPKQDRPCLVNLKLRGVVLKLKG